CPCILLSARMIGNIDVPEGFDHFPDLILAFLRAGRRRGLLVRIDNHITLDSGADFDSEILQQETAKMLQLFADYESVSRRIATHPAYSEERRLQVLRNTHPAVA